MQLAAIWLDNNPKPCAHLKPAGLKKLDRSQPAFIESFKAGTGKANLAKLKSQDNEFLKKERNARNNFAHFNFLNLPVNKDDKPVSFTDLVTEQRELLAYDRKRKNGVTKIVIDLLDREGFEINWRIGKNHSLVAGDWKEKPKFLTVKKIKHLVKQKQKCDQNSKGKFIKPKITENRHSERMLELMKAALTEKIYK